ncbi:glycosyl transferase family 2 [Winogradskyella sp. PC-19]|uniref:glycosyltransferase family 2 protein n=1 Tax=unclassified Winogradskyella TaxID=2615021 RepID=UPI000B3D2805|nr:MULTISPECIES: glycosyltransferase family 2 protein [unclassified Winogradskyella]ARV09244.1 glycosyl transferase family 2 [Winogradskyella sp. PC-19]RZN82440.1 MAG: glycosyltransferase family 2 protein [Winogradskyella sp.]
MKFYIVIPAHNEDDSITLTIESLANQTLLPKKVVIVNDNSTDNTQTIVEKFVDKYEWLTLVNNQSSDLHLPGTKIINAFYKGYNTLDENYDIICKFDADLIFPIDYLEKLSIQFKENDKLGMAAGYCYIEQNGNWTIESLTNKDHIRGALKAYRKACFIQIGKLKPSMGWDTVDELLAKYYNWEILTIESLKVKHLKPTGESYNKASKHLQGEAMYKLRNGIVITTISALKMAFKKRKISEFANQMSGYFKAKLNKTEHLVNEDQGKFIRKLRWKGIFSKLF